MNNTHMKHTFSKTRGDVVTKQFQTQRFKVVYQRCRCALIRNMAKVAHAMNIRIYMYMCKGHSNVPRGR